VKVADGPSLVKTAKRQLGFKLALRDEVAPAGATGAQVMLGHTDYTVTSSQVMFDDVSFSELIHK
jgi:hypothetical protein